MSEIKYNNAVLTQLEICPDISATLYILSVHLRYSGYAC